jgi:hypothetical protein
MIASQKIGKSFMGALSYNMKKLWNNDNSKRAELLATNFSSSEAKNIKQEVEWVRQLRPGLNRYVYHTSLNFSNEEVNALTNEKLLAIAQDYLQSLGYTNNQYLIFRHYDAEHPHIHLLVNRITFDGEVVSDSNNYKRSEDILRNLERRYNLIPVAPSRKASQRAVTKSEIEMIDRTGKPSDKMLLQEQMNRLFRAKGINMNDFIQRGEQAGIHFLFNQASTGRVTGITYFYNGLKVKGQALGNRYKWAELIKSINYEQSRHGEAISQANNRTTAKYGKQTPTEKPTTTDGQRRSGTGVVSEYSANDVYKHRESEFRHGNIIGNEQRYENGDGENEERSLEAGQNVDFLPDDGVDILHNNYTDFNIEIAEDVDDEAIYGKDRHRQRKARTNSR